MKALHGWRLRSWGGGLQRDEPLQDLGFLDCMGPNEERGALHRAVKGGGISETSSCTSPGA
jgi:hypothetical protein